MVEKRLTLALAKAYRDDPDSVDLAGFTSINDDALDLLAKLDGDHDGGTLRLSGLTTPTPEQIHRLKSTELALELGGVQEISVELAHSLRELDKAALRFPGVSSAGETVLSSLAEYHGPELQLGLASLTDIEASVLAQSGATVLSLPSLATLDERAATALAAHDKAISLPSLSRLTAAAATSLASHCGPLRDIDLIRLADADYAAFAALRRHPSLVAHVLDDPRFLKILRSKDIDLTDNEGWGFPFADCVSRKYFERGFGYDGIPIDDGIAFVMKAEGRPLWRVELPDSSDKRPTAGAGEYVLYFIGDWQDIVSRLRSLPDRMLTEEVAKRFLDNPDAVDLEEYGAISEGAGSILVQSEEPLDLNGLSDISDTAAKVLSKTNDSLRLDGLTSISDKAIQSLSRAKGILSLDGLVALNQAAAAALATHESDASAYGVVSLSDAVAAELSRKSCGTLWLSNNVKCSDAAEQRLRSCPHITFS
jgi:hypothetical protein